jgi:hypothetical protein
VTDEQPDPRARPDNTTLAGPSEIPEHFFGDLTDDFYAGIGRTTNQCALLEDRLRALLQAMEHVAQTEYSNKPAGTLVNMAEARAQTLGNDWATFDQFVGRIRAVLGHRNDLVHNIWQPKPEGQFFGHRVVQKSGERESTVIPLKKVQDGVSELVALHEQWRYWYTLAGSLPFEPQQSTPS